MADSTLPRELQLIIDDIVEQQVHLLEWEVFGNTTEDMRVVLTWRRIDGGKGGEIEQSRWKIDNDGAGDVDEWGVGAGNKLKQDEKEKEGKRKEEEERKRKQKEAEEKEIERKRKEEEERKRKQKEEEEKEKKRKEEEAKRKKEEEKKKKEKEEVERKRKQKEEEERKRKQKEEEEEEERVRKEKEEEERKRKQKEDEERKRKEDEERKRKQKELEGQEKQRKKKEQEEEEKRRKKRELEEQEYNRRKKELENKENEEKLQQLEEEENRRKLKLREDEEKQRKKREFEEQEYNRRKQEIEDAENKRKEDEENMNAAKQLEDEENRRRAKAEHEGKRNKKKSKVQEGDDDDENEYIDLTHKRPKTKDHAMRMLMMQRSKLSASIDLANLDQDEMDKRFPGGPPGGISMAPDNGNSSNNETDLSAVYGSNGFSLSFDEYQLKKGYDIEYDGSTYKSSKIKRYNLRSKTTFVSKTRIGAPVIRVISQTFDTLAWQGCVDCQYNDFCDKSKHKDEYMHMLFEDAKNPLDHPINQALLAGCECNVCTGGAVHNGCFYRELLRLKSEYRVFDKYNYCFCTECIPFVYRRICLRRELALLREEKEEHYYRLTKHDDDDGIIRHQLIYSSEGSDYGSDDDDENYEEGKFQAVLLDDIPLKITKHDKISFRDCPDCQCNGFCDDIRHKKIYQMLVHIDDEDFDELEDECWCLVCEFKGAAHSGCAEREIRRLKYDLLLFDVRNLCYCHECVPFKYRKVCLRQEMKKRRRGRRAENQYALL